MFENAYAEASGGSSRDHYYKIFVQNTNATKAYLGVSIALSGGDGAVTFALEASRNGTDSTTNRITAPTAGYTFNTSTKSVPGSDLEEAGGNDRIGIWLKYTLAAGATPSPFSFTVTAEGQSRG